MTAKYECSKWLHALFGILLFTLVVAAAHAQADDEPAEKTTDSIQMSDVDILVFENGAWKNEKTGETIPDGTLVQGTRGTLRLDRNGEEGVVSLVSGEGVSGRGIRIQVDHGGTKIEVGTIPAVLADMLKLGADLDKIGVGKIPGFLALKSNDRSNQVHIHTIDESGNPLGNVDIRVLTNSKDATRPKTTDENGTMVLQLPDSPRELFISANAPGRVSQLVHWEREDMNSGFKIPNAITFTLRKGDTIGGVVVDQDDNPVKGAVLHILSRPDGFGMPGHLKPADSHILAWGDGKPNTFGGVTSCKTDQNGRWTLDNVPDGKFYPVSIEIFHPDYIKNDDLGSGSFLLQNDALIEKLRKGEYRFVMKRGVFVSGMVCNAEGQPLKDALVVPGGDPWYYYDDRQKAVRTDAEGKYRIHALRLGSGTLTVIAEGFAPDMKSLDFEKNMKPVDFELKSGKTISFRCIDENGTPIPKVQVDIGSNPNGWWREGANIFNNARSGANQASKIPVYADKEGLYRWDWAPEDRMKFAFHKEGFLMESSSRENWFVARPEPYEIVLHRQKTFRGTVVDAETNQPIQQYKIAYGSQPDNSSDIESYLWQTPQEQTFTATETFQFVPLFWYDKYWFRFTAEGYEPFVAGPYPLNEQTPKLKIALKRATPSAMLTGQVLLPNGNPAALAKILLIKEREMVQITPPHLVNFTRKAPRPILETDEQGKFQLELPTDDKDYRLYVAHSEGFAQIDKADVKEGLTLQLQAYGRLEINIPYDTRPQAYNQYSFHKSPDAVVVQFDQDKKSIVPERKMFGFLVYSGSISPEGTAVIDSIVPGRYSFLKMVREGNTVRNVTNFFIDIPPDETKQWDLTAPNGVKVTARIRLPDDYEGEFTVEDWSTSQFSLSDASGQTSLNYHGKMRPAEDNSREATIEIEQVVPGPYRYSIILHKSVKRDRNAPLMPSTPDMKVGFLTQPVSIPESTESETRSFDLGTIEVSRHP